MNVLQIGSAAGGHERVNSGIATQLGQINGVLGDGVLSPTSDPNISTLNWQYAAQAGRSTIPPCALDYNLNDSVRLERFLYADEDGLSGRECGGISRAESIPRI